jgi:hypothetical protein
MQTAWGINSFIQPIPFAMNHTPHLPFRATIGLCAERMLHYCATRIASLAFFAVVIGNSAHAQIDQNDTTDDIAVEFYIIDNGLSGCGSGGPPASYCQVVNANSTYSIPLNPGEYLSGTKISCCVCINTPVASTACPGSTSSFTCGSNNWTARQTNDDIFLY